MGHEKTGEELEALCSEHPEQVEQLTKENLEILISWLIESQKTQAQQQLFKQCLTQLERFPEYEDDVDLKQCKREDIIIGRICYKYWDKQPNSKHAKNEFGFRSVC